MGRKRLDIRRNDQIQIRSEEAHKEFIRAAAETEGLSLSGFALKHLLQISERVLGRKFLRFRKKFYE